MKNFPYLCIYILFFCCGYIFGQVLITEIMFDPMGSDYTQEFVEIYNSGLEDVSLDGWALGDGQSIDLITQVNNGFVLCPGQFGLILDGDYVTGEGVYDSLIPDTALVLSIDGSTIGSGGLSNSQAETITLLDENGGIVDFVQYSIGNLSGYSDERVFLSQESLSLWKDSQILYGSPGFYNSVSPRLFDLGIKLIQPDNYILNPSEAIILEGWVYNAGIQACAEATLDFLEKDLRETLLTDQIFNSQKILDVLPGDSIYFYSEWRPLKSGSYCLRALIDYKLDEKEDNNCDSLELQVRYNQHDLVFNELMIQPIAEQGEWIELFNSTDEAIDLQGWKLSDVFNDERLICDYVFIVNSGDYCIIYQNENDFSGIENEVYMKMMPRLNNNEDYIKLIDPTGNVIDEVVYQVDASLAAGITLEKRNPRWLSQDPDSWTSCVSLSGNTKGKENSVFFETRQNNSQLLIEPNPFTPDGDGDKDVAIIQYQLSDINCRINVFIFDIAGRLIRRLRNGQYCGVQGQLIWDGKNDYGKSMNTGIYIVFMEVLVENKGVIQVFKNVLVLVRNR